MKVFKEYKREIIFFVILIVSLCIAGLLITIFKNKDTEIEENNDNQIDVSDVNNVDLVESSLSYKMKITQGYLLNYTTNKSGIWYMSKGIVKDIKKKDDITYITLSNEDNSYSLVTEISSDRVSIKKKDTVNFVGTIDLETGHIELAKISSDNIIYSDVTEIEFSSLVKNIKTIKDNIFVVNGYMVTDGNRYKLYDTKSAYQIDEGAGNYFNISWNKEFNYTGNANVTLECKINGTYKLKECTLIK